MAMAITIAFCFVSWSEPIQKQPIPQSKSKELTQQKTSNQQNPPIQFVTPQQLLDAITRTIDASNEKNKSAQNPLPPDNSQWWFSLFLVIFTCCLVIVGGIQCYIIFNTLRETQVVAKAATDSARVADQALQISQRAYLTIDQISLKNPLQQDKIPVVQLKIINNGRTPAQVIEIFSKIDIFSEIPKKPVYSKGDVSLVQMTIGANSPTTLHIVGSDVVITAQELTDIHTIKRKFFVWGRIIYQDVFKNSIVLGFGAQYSPHGFVPAEGYDYIKEYEPDKD